MYAFSSALQCIQVIHLLSVFVFPGNRTHNLLRNALTTEPREHMSMVGRCCLRESNQRDQKHLNLCFEDERRSYRFGTT